MEKQEWKSFFGFVDTASSEQLERKLLRLTLLEMNLQEPAVKNDCKRMRKHINEEILARNEVDEVSRTYKSPTAQRTVVASISS